MVKTNLGTTSFGCSYQFILVFQIPLQAGRFSRHQVIGLGRRLAPFMYQQLHNQPAPNVLSCPCIISGFSRTMRDHFLPFGQSESLVIVRTCYFSRTGKCLAALSLKICPITLILLLFSLSLSEIYVFNSAISKSLSPA